MLTLLSPCIDVRAGSECAVGHDLEPLEKQEARLFRSSRTQCEIIQANCKAGPIRLPVRRPNWMALHETLKRRIAWRRGVSGRVSFA
jgi:hypothetical protein